MLLLALQKLSTVMYSSLQAVILNTESLNIIAGAVMFSFSALIDFGISVNLSTPSLFCSIRSLWLILHFTQKAQKNAVKKKNVYMGTLRDWKHCSVYARHVGAMWRFRGVSRGELIIWQKCWIDSDWRNDAKDNSAAQARHSSEPLLLLL